MTPTVDLDSLAVAVRLGLALLAGGLIGIDREFNRKPAGMRTHALVSMGSAIVVIAMAAATQGHDDAVSRAVQGIMAGIGFIGAGAILQYEERGRVEGLTTAASVWVAAGLGVACGLGLIELAIFSVVAVLVVLVAGNWVEAHIQRNARKNEIELPRDGNGDGKA